MNKKRGITLTSIVIYIILFFLFTSFITVLSTRLNKNLFDDRGMAINVNNVNKTEYNLLKSGNESESITITDIDSNSKSVSFSNGDTYVFNNDSNSILKNGGILVKNVIYDASNMTYTDNLLNVKLTFNKYLNEIERTIKISVGV